MVRKYTTTTSHPPIFAPLSVRAALRYSPGGSALGVGMRDDAGAVVGKSTVWKEGSCLLTASFI